MTEAALLEQVRQVGHRARRLLWIRGLFIVLAGTMLGALAISVTDYCLGAENPWVRWLLSAGALAGCLLISFRVLRPLRQLDTGPLQTARWIERSIPLLKDRLSSAVQFLQDGEAGPIAGSVDLRKTLLQQVINDLQSCDLQQVLDFRHIRRAGAAVLGTVVLLSILALWHPGEFRVGLSRLMLPWKIVRWPTAHSLSFASLPEYVTQGSELQIQVFDTHGDLPPRVDLWYRSEGDPSKPPVRYKMHLRDSMAEWTLSNLRQSFQVRAVGGDDSHMAWIRVNVVSAPAVVESQLWLTPPEYTKWPRAKVDKDFRALPGTFVSLQARADRPLHSATLVFGDPSNPVRERFATQTPKPHRQEVDPDTALINRRRRAATRPKGEETASGQIPLAVSTDGRQVSLHEGSQPGWRITSSAQYFFEFVDTKGVVSRIPAGTVTVQPDQPPEIDLQEPGESWIGGPQSLVPLRAQVSDDLSVAEVQLAYRLTDRESQQETLIPLFRQTAPPRSAADVENGPEIHQVIADWSLSQIPDLQPGSVISWYLIARDTRGQQKASPVRTWTMQADEQLRRHFARQDQRLFSRLREILQAQQSARQSLQQTQQSLLEEHRNELSDPLRYQSLALAQRNVRERLTDSNTAVLQQLRTLQDMIRRSGTQTDQGLRTRSDWIDRLTQLDASTLGLLEEILSRIKHNTSAPDQIPAQGLLTQDLRQAETLQEQVIQEILGLLTDRQQLDRLRSDLAHIESIQSEQESLLLETSQLVGLTVVDTLDSISAALRGQLESLADRQWELAQRMEQIVAGSITPPTDLQEEQFARLSASRQLAQQLGVAGQMRRAAEELRKNRLGNATQKQQDVNYVLRQMLDLLLGNSPADWLHRTQNAPSVPRDLDASSAADLASTSPESTPSEIAMLLQLQRELNQRTRLLNRERRAAEEPIPETLQELNDLAQRQRELADRLERLWRVRQDSTNEASE